MKSLAFSAPSERFRDARGRRVKAARFEARSALPLGAACVVANGVRETLSSLLGAPIAMRLLAPSIPSPHAWQAILRDARCYRVRGNVADAAIVLRPADANALSAALFGEPGNLAQRPSLSPIECDVLDRMVARIAANLGTVCGTREGQSLERTSSLAGFVTYFELAIDEPVGARVGIALSRDPSHEARGCLEVKHLAAIELRAFATIDLGHAKAATVARIAVGSTIPIESALLARATLATHGKRLADGGGGVRNGRYAFRIERIRDALYGG